MKPAHSLILALFPMLFLLSACGRSSPTNYYLLESSLGTLAAANLPDKSLRVSMVEVPAYLNRNNIVSRVKGQTQLILAEFHLWAEPVSNGVRRVVQECLLPKMLELGINVLPLGTENGGDFVLELDLQRLDGNFAEKAVLEIRWALLDKNDKPLLKGIFADEELVPGRDYNILVGAESRLLRRFGEYLAARLCEKLGPKLKNNS